MVRLVRGKCASPAATIAESSAPSAEFRERVTGPRLSVMNFIHYKEAARGDSRGRGRTLVRKTPTSTGKFCGLGGARTPDEIWHNRGAIPARHTFRPPPTL